MGIKTGLDSKYLIADNFDIRTADVTAYCTMIFALLIHV